MTATFAEAFRVWARIGVLSFGGPAGQIALLHKEVVEQRNWLEEKEFLNALNFCMLLPGPEAQQLATYCGWKLHGVRGGLAAGLLFVLPGACVIFALSVVYAWIGNVPFVQAAFFGIKCAVLAIVLEALLKVAKRALKGKLDWLIAVAAFVALFGFGLPFALVVAVAALVGFFRASSGDAVQVARPSIAGTVRTVATWLVIWLVPLLALRLALGGDHVLTRLAQVFSTLAVVTFGGAYSVLASLGQTMVEQTGWLTPAQMMDGFGLAETTPGPLILVGQFVSFMAAQNTLGTIGAGAAASLVFLWMTFTPCFLWIFAGAPWLQYISSKPRVQSALAAITAAVTGVILNLSLWFGLHVIFRVAERRSGPIPVWWPEWTTFDGAALVLAVVSALLLLHWKAGIPKTLVFAALAGLLWSYGKSMI
jgi:chromate transporter